MAAGLLPQRSRRRRGHGAESPGSTARVAREIDMNVGKPRLLLSAIGIVCFGALAAIVQWSGIAFATPSFQFNSEILSRSLFEEIRINTARHHKHGRGGHGHDDESEQDENAFKVQVKVPDPSDVYIVRNRVPPGGYSGWHTHPGPSIVSVKAGTATVYDGDDPSCTPATYAAGTGFIDEGGGHVHMVRNEGSVELEVIAFQIVPTGAERRIDAPAPGFCGF